ncbi:DUF4857 domain-containing protein [Pseudodesulfovibrio sediminis]|uniref:DUF4857 domain-containing protein n=1 Tax=Pseudodesulfovibrio sediminis TaxID=2810563 RepID=A0ABM7P5P1_9BACT|nr:DUF4857 domain-containing protein [Pseudodesulfovibrio sediminis]BCS88132.1 hypothetical protein PSDVSF_13740 [Pseudodesulfovibrio sediminis]
MVSVARFSAVLVIVLGLSMTLPGLFIKATSVKVRPPGIYYSPLLERFVMQQGKQHRDEYGNILSAREFRRSLPFLYRADLVKWGEFPSRVGRVKVDPSIAARELQFVRISPRDINAPKFEMYMMLESSPEGAHLEYPSDMFLLKDGIEFYGCADNSLDKAKSELFTAAMLESGFVFPARIAGGNPDARKPFDWGYFLLDSTNTLFHLMMVKGQPLCVNTGKQFQAPVRHITVVEHPRKEFYAVVVTATNMFLISCDDYELIDLPLLDYNPDVDSVMLLATLTHRVVQQRTQNQVLLTALDGNWDPVSQFGQMIDLSPLAMRERLAALLFPFELESTSRFSKFKPFHFKVVSSHPMWTLSGIFLCLVTYWLFVRKRFRGNPTVWELAILSVMGVYGLIALVAVGRVKPLCRT